MSARLTVVRNPIIPEKNRYVGEFPFKTIGEARAWLDGQEVNITVDNWLVTDDYEPKTGEMVLIMPVIGKGGGKSVFGVVAMVALAVVSHGIATGGWLAGAGIAAGTTAAYGIAAATLFIGGTLISRSMTSGAKADVGRHDYENNATYSWGDPQTMEGQNNAIAETYGKVQSAGQTLGKFVSLSGNDEVLNWLVGCGKGELDITDIKLNDNPIEYYKNISCEIRRGTNDQEIISNFNDTYFTENVSALMSGSTPVVRQAQGTATEGLIYKISCDQGLYYANDDGGLSTAWVRIQMDYRLHAAPGEEENPWTVWQTVQISGAQNNALRREYRLDNLPAGQYDIRTTCVGRSHSESSSRAGVKVWLNSITSIVYDDFVYPGIALIGIKGLATDQLNGSPTIKFIKERKFIWAYNPNTGMYEEQPANNPAWAAYDMLHQAQKVMNINTGKYEFVFRGVDKNHILYDQFKEWGDWCEDMDLHINLEICETGEMLDLINSKIACIGRGLVIRFGTRYGAKWSHAQNPVQMFGMGNIVKDTFEESFLSIDDRANAVEITFTDAERDYQRRTITVFGENYNTDATEKVAQATYDGITSYEQAFREGMYQLACNKYLLRTVSFDADVDSIACTVGDVIVVSHDIVQAAYSGRISKVVGRVVTLPTVDPVDTTQSYKLMYRSSEHDTLEEYDVSVAYNENNELEATILGEIDPDPAPAVNDIYDLALVTMGRRMFTIQSITRSSEFRRHIEALEYNAQVYSEDYDIPEIEYSRGGDVAQNVTGLSCAQVAYVRKDGTRASQLNVSWVEAVGGGHYNVYISTNGKDWTPIATNTSKVQVKADVQPWTTYYVKVVTILGVSQSSGVVEYPVPPGDDVLPPNVLQLDCEVLKDGTRRYHWDFNYPEPNDIAGFKMKYCHGTGGNWNIADDVQDGLITAQPYEAKTIRQGTHTIFIKAVDNAGQESPLPATCIINFGKPLEENVLETKDFSENGWGELNFGEFWDEDENKEFWNPNEETDFWVNHSHNGTARGCYVGADNKIYTDTTDSYWANPGDNKWTGEDDYEWTAQYCDFYVDFTHVAQASGYWWLDYEISGTFNIYYWINNDGIKKQYNTRIKVNAGDVIHISVEGTANMIIVSSLVSIIDVPDRVEHFESIDISSEGTELPIKTPNYKTITVHLDSLPLENNEEVYLEEISKEPSIIRLRKKDGTPITATAKRITWQGYEREVISNG
ncbi:MAG: hypothetical protein KBS60_01190 [Phascolarctobacterium sp.]|nr:hypothetical protein [Candidatus Phascolarctobacterium caballi]